MKLYFYMYSSLWAIRNKSNFTVEVQQLCPIRYSLDWLLFDLKCALWFRMHLRKWHDNECNCIQTLESVAGFFFFFFISFALCIIWKRENEWIKFHNFCFQWSDIFLLLFVCSSWHRCFDVRKYGTWNVAPPLCLHLRYNQAHRGAVDYDWKTAHHIASSAVACNRSEVRKLKFFKMRYGVTVCVMC